VTQLGVDPEYIYGEGGIKTTDTYPLLGATPVVTNTILSLYIIMNCEIVGHEDCPYR